MNLPPYPSYRTSEIEWTGELPSKWDVAPAFAIVRESRSPNRGNVETNVLSLSYGRIVSRDVERHFGLLPESFETYQIVNPGSIVLRLTDLQNDKRSLRVGYVDQSGIITSAYLNLVAKGRLVPRYLYYLLHYYDLRKVFYGMGSGVRQSMGFADLRRMPLIVPSTVEQRAIAAFLDRETAKIDTLIEKQEQLIDLLEEKRQAVITHAVTKGLNPDVRMKDSGVEWLGEVPEHWRLVPLRYLSPQVTVGIVVTPAKYYVENGIACLRSMNVKPNRVNKEQLVYISQESNEYLSKTQLRTGDIVIVRTGQPGTAAPIDASMEGWNCIDLIIVRRSDQVDSEFLAYSVNSDVVRRQVGLASGGAIQQHFNVEVAKLLLIPLPPYQEQAEILEFVCAQSKKLDVLVENALRSKELLRERRNALISAAVTGKIDVRNAV